jgi:Amt family ammonium transporter
MLCSRLTLRVQTLNGVLVGLVSITAGCAVVEPYAAVIIGLIGAVVYAVVSEFVKRVLKIDDVVDAFAVHCGGGMWGLIAASLFATKVRPHCCPPDPLFHRPRNTT